MQKHLTKSVPFSKRITKVSDLVWLTVQGSAAKALVPRLCPDLLPEVPIEVIENCVEVFWGEGGQIL